jgi:hypothetical protein
MCTPKQIPIFCLILQNYKIKLSAYFVFRTGDYKIKNRIGNRVIFPGHNKKRPGQPETVRSNPEQPGNSAEQPGTVRVLEITPVVLEYCLNRIFVEIIYGYIIVLNKVCRIS